MTQRLEAEGNKYPESHDEWDDGSDHDDVTKIFVRGCSLGIQYIQFSYIKNGQPKFGSVHGFPEQGFTQTFEINHLRGEHLESVEGYYLSSSNVIQGIQFKTNLRISELIGFEKNGAKFSLSVDGKKIIGFHGSAAAVLNSLGAYFTWITPTRLEAQGRKGGEEWNDGSDHDGVTKIHVRGCYDIIQYAKFDYVKDGQDIYGSVHGASSRAGYTQTFEIDHVNNEELVSVEGYYDNDRSGAIHGLEFKTNIKTSGLIGDAKGNMFRLAANGKKIIGFHGYTEKNKNLNSLGAYFTTSPLTKLECSGEKTEGVLWDDGAYDGVKKVTVYYDDTFIRCVRFDYDNGGKVERLEHGTKFAQEDEFVVDYPNEFITSVEGTLGGLGLSVRVCSLLFKTSKGRTSQTFGKVSSYSDFVLESKGCALVGFHGRTSDVIRALGAYCRPLPPLLEAEKLQAHGGDGGASWDDGGFDGVRNIYIGQSEMGISFLKFLYHKDDQAVVGDDHGSKTLTGDDDDDDDDDVLISVLQFDLKSPCEYLISVEGKYDVVDGSEFGIIRMLRFKTNMRTSQVFGLETTSNFTLEKECHKIVGFHGKVSNMLTQIGVHVLPISEHSSIQTLSS